MESLKEEVAGLTEMEMCGFPQNQPSPMAALIGMSKYEEVAVDIETSIQNHSELRETRQLKNIQVVDGAANSTLDIYAVSDELFDLMFPAEQNVSFVMDVEQRREESGIDEIKFWQAVYQNKLPKAKVCGIDGTLHLTGSSVEKEYFPTRREEEVSR